MMFFWHGAGSIEAGLGTQRHAKKENRMAMASGEPLEVAGSFGLPLRFARAARGRPEYRAERPEGAKKPPAE